MIAALVSAALCASPAAAEEYDFHQLGDAVTLGDLVSNPDITLQLVAFDPKGAVTLALKSRDASKILQQPQISLAYNEPQEIFLKRECASGVCRAYVATVRWVGRTTTGKFEFRYDVKIMPSRSS